MAYTFDKIDLEDGDILGAFTLINNNYDVLTGYLNDIDDGTGDGGSGGLTSVSYTDLTDTGETLFPNCFPFVNNTASSINLMGFASDSAYGTGLSDSIEIDHSSHPDYVIFKAVPSVIASGMTDEIQQIVSMSFSNIESDFNMNGYNIVNISPITPQAVIDFNNIHSSSYSIDDFVVNKRFTDYSYYSVFDPLLLNDIKGESNFRFLIDNYDNNNIKINGHGLNSSLNGTPVHFSAELNKPSMLTEDTIYYMRVYDENSISLYSNKNNAITQDLSIANSTKIEISGNASGNQHYIIFEGWDPDTYGQYLASQAVPRKDVVLRIGDRMTGPLILHDHPGGYSGFEQNELALQAASTHYVDKSIQSNNAVSSVRGPSYINFQSGDLVAATGYYRIAVTGLNLGQWTNGESFSEKNDPTKNGILRDILEIDSNKHIVTYSTNGALFEVSDVIANDVDEATVDDVYEEYSQARLDNDSHLDISVNRNDYSEYADNDPVSSLSLTIKNNVITSDMFKVGEKLPSDALDLNKSGIFTETEWDSPTEDSLGVCSFHTDIFDVKDGYVRIKDSGISLNHIQDIANKTVIGSYDNGGKVNSVTFEDIIDQGGGITEDNFLQRLVDVFDENTFEDSNGSFVIKDYSIGIEKLQQIPTGNVIGRNTMGAGPVELIPIGDLGGGSGGGISQNNLSDEFSYEENVLALNDYGVALSKLQFIPSMTVLGNVWNEDAEVRSIPLSSNSDSETIVYRTPSGAISCSELKLNEKKILKTTNDELSAFVPTGQRIFTASCGDTCDFDGTETNFNGSVRATAFNTESDERKKTDINTLKNSLYTINQLRGVSFRWKDNFKKDLGVIAQEIENVLPELVNTDSKGFKSVSYANIIGLLIEGIKDMSSYNLYSAKEDYEIGTVVVLGNEYDLTLTNIKGDKKIAGIVKNSIVNEKEFLVQLFNKGKAMCKVIGPTLIGDLLVASAIPGYAIVDNSAVYSNCIGKCMKNKESDKKDLVEIISMG